MSVSDLRQSYERGVLLEQQAAATPIDQFALWFDEAQAAQVPEPNAMTLATVDASGQPSARIVLIKAFDARGFTFFTNYTSRKGEDLLANPRAALLFFWQALERQVRIEGVVERVSADESDAYFHSRPVGSRIGAWASEQSQPITREALEARERDFKARFGDTPPRPPHWGGYRLVPTYFEFWQGRPSRLHDRLRYRPDGKQGWVMDRLSP
ncbi:pyridoxamine 5'-phosphate oxidase [Bordetella avium]|uniref:Pyridoxine/pyridoxamine 5'-phosphate oxidase n=1 Tax=Bordetella avium (strain 197N) TaxID=360910 RepID=PDXH_BORA1|nr:pyridoxamine 5'-phosphate oxidase [Bordetella avium]Q2KVR0.1 RecName: Full=Pyridoxine/pyridoxamine 5'-phosphate oxidase; AltName: Full=PNP/PMP oxidase; Short=PNPOx; AltName: Full=Pyridoxal 5'-phosphate synthase [Bordetella avium 197N]AZY53584.1 pyridoxine/pyridoxamine 5'-phosphate oxidase [Bordetella avium]RIQ47566.1 pyridoxamine 5'-phosphate oxidase [Bordetella avium]RIQ68361.1 pyridoxamine 5'-phosphate oxidase [Bordetella avium]CAJ50433.1 pyridoxamine 5'-phosphate oxidase [Bordetella aviu